MIFKTKYSKAVLVTFLSMFVVHVIAYSLDFYYVVPNFDIPMHLWGGATVAMFFVWLFYFSGKVSLLPQSKIFYLFLILGSVALVGLAWEFFEFVGDNSFAKGVFQGNLADTMSDLLNDLIGGLITALYLYPKTKKTNAQ